MNYDSAELLKLEEKLGYTFRDKNLCVRAATHSSYANEVQGDPALGNERLEFLGDSILDLVVSIYIYERFSEKAEGDLTKLRASVVCENALASLAHEMNLGEFILLGHGEELSGGRERNALLADFVEALLGAVFLDGGQDAASRVIHKLFAHLMEEALNGELPKDNKTELQEILQKGGQCTIDYELAGEEGPDHAKIFTVELYADGKKLGSGRGRSKKQAEQAAAGAALKELKKTEVEHVF